MIEIVKFDFYNLMFTDRATYQHYKEILPMVNFKNSVYTKGFTVGLDDYCLDRLEEQFKHDGYYTSNTKDYPQEVFSREVDGYVQQVFLTVGTSYTIPRKK